MEGLDPVWISEDTWVCRRHMGDIRLPASSEKCWYSGCSARPPRDRKMEVRPEALVAALSIVRPRHEPPPRKTDSRRPSRGARSPEDHDTRTDPGYLPSARSAAPEPAPAPPDGASDGTAVETGLLRELPVPAPDAVDAPSISARLAASILSEVTARGALATNGITSAGQPICEWHRCDKPARPNSKYCSRRCSNRNARNRHRIREREDKKRSIA